MKMRHKASPGDPKDKNSSIHPDQRLHVKVFVGDTEHIFWFRRVRHNISMRGAYLNLPTDNGYRQGLGSSSRAIEIEVSGESSVL